MSGKPGSPVVSGGENVSRFGSLSRLPHMSRRAGVLAAAAIVMVAILFGYQYYYNHKHQSDATPAVTQEVVDEAVNKTVEHPDYALAEKELNTQLAATKDNKKRATIYVDLASIALQQSQYQGVVDNELKAIQADPSQEGSQSRTLADAYYLLGVKPDALKYYQIALAYYNSQPATFSGRSYYITSIQARIAELSK